MKKLYLLVVFAMALVVPVPAVVADDCTCPCQPASTAKLDRVSIPAISEFSPRGHFTVSVLEKPEVRIGYLGDNFKNHFLGKVETNISATTLTARTLTKSSLDGPILTELGDRAQTSLVHLWHFLSRQPNGESGILLTNGDWNVFYIRDDNGTLWAVYARWSASDGVWRVDAYSVGYPSGWSAGARVFSRK